MGIVGASIGSGFVLGPAFATIIMSSGGSYSIVFLTAAIICVLGFFIALIKMKETNKHMNEKEKNPNNIRIDNKTEEVVIENSNIPKDLKIMDNKESKFSFNS